MLRSKKGKSLGRVRWDSGGEEHELSAIQSDRIKDRFDQYRTSLFKATEKGYIHFLLSLRTSYHIQKFPINPSVDFWPFTWYAHSESSFSLLSRILERRKDETNLITIHTFLDLVEKEKAILFPPEAIKAISAAIDEDRLFLQNRMAFIEHLICFRDNFMAHFDRRYMDKINSLKANFQLFDNDVEEIFMAISDILNRYSKYYDGRELILNYWKKVSINLEFLPFERS